MKIALASDHRGAESVRALIERLRDLGHEPLPCGPTTDEPRDYPDGALLVGTAVSRGDAECGILVCGSGIGVSIAANKVVGVRAALAQDATAAEMSRRHNDANVLCMSADRNDIGQILAIADAFLAARFEGGRHARRVEKITAIESGRSLSAQEA